MELRRRSTTRPPDTHNPGVEAHPPDLVILSQEGGAALDAEQDLELWDLTKTKPSRWRASKKRTLQAGRRWRRQEHAKPRRSRRKRAPRSQGLWSKVVPPSQVQRLSARASRIPETRNFWRFRNEHVRSSQPWQVPEILHHSLLALLLGSVPAHTLRDVGTADHPGLTGCTGDVFDSDAEYHDMRHGQAQKR